VGSDEAVSIKQLAERVAIQFQPKIPIKILQVWNPLKQHELYVPDIQKVKFELKVDVRVSLITAIQKTAMFQRRSK
jgi:nucleoside-diphosphate-sugar epimerase